ncbi:MAG: ACT domain-containing protein [Mycobacteriales bacterium]
MSHDAQHDGPGDAPALTDEHDAGLHSEIIGADSSAVYVVHWESAPDHQPILDPDLVAVARYPSGWRPPGALHGFHAVIDDGTETTVLCTEDALAQLDPPLASEPGWRRITFPGPLPWQLVGFLADVAGRLAAARIPLAAMAGFTTDHVLVRDAHAELAMSVLKGNPPPPARPGTYPVGAPGSGL